MMSMRRESHEELPPRSTAQCVRVLLVEDNPGDAMLVEEMLSDAAQMTFEVTAATTLARAITSLREAPPDVVLADLGLPDADGLSIVTDVLLAAPRAAVVVLSGRDDERLAVRAVRSGAQDYLIKGTVTSRVVLRSIRYALERKRIEQKLAHDAEHDPLTGLGNRAHFQRCLQSALVHASRATEIVALLFLDLDGFKAVNDTLGHCAGDELLREVARRIASCVRPSDVVARPGGDEFTVLLTDLASPATARAVAQRILGRLGEPFWCSGKLVSITASIGISLFPDDDSDDSSLEARADLAMYRAKKAGRGRVQLFSDLPEPA